MQTQKVPIIIAGLFFPLAILGLATAYIQPVQAEFQKLLFEKPVATIEMNQDKKYLPEKITITVGSTLEWKNTSDIIHTGTVDPEKAVDKK